MKIVNIGDVLLHPEFMSEAEKKFSRYTEVQDFFFGPESRPEIRKYIKIMEAEGSKCVPLPREIVAACKDADVIQVHQAPIPAEIFEEAENLKLLLVNRGGIENIDLEAATKAGVPVLANPAHNANAVAEMTIGLMIAEMRNIGRCHAAMSILHEWREKYPNDNNCHELRGRTVGLVGFGSIGRIVCRLLLAFQVDVVVYDPFVNPENIRAAGARPMDFDELLMTSDVVSLHVRVSESTKGMMGEKQFRLMKPTAVFINTARGPLVDNEAMYRALNEGWIMGAALDNYAKEPLPKDDKLLKLDNVTFSCHKAGDTVECFVNSPEMLLSEAEKYFEGGTPRFLMNPQIVRKQ